MRTARQTLIRRALLAALAAIPEGFLLPEEVLRADAARGVYTQRPTAAELTAEIAAADTGHLIVGVVGEDGTRWQLTDGGRAWLLQHP